MSDTGIRIVELPDLGAATDAASVVAEKSGSGRISLPAVRSYVLNGAFPEAPLDGSAYGRYNAGWVKTLPLTGGTVSGNLTVAGSATTVVGSFYCGAILINPRNSYEWFMTVDSSGNHIQQHRTNWWDDWSDTTGLRRWLGPSGVLMSLDGTGHLVTANNISTNGNVNSSGFWVNGTSDTFGLSLGGSGRILQFRSGFYLDHSTIAGGTDGTLQYVDAGGPLWVMRASDHFCFNPQSAVGGNGAYINTSDRRVKENVTPSDKGLAEVLQLQPVTFTRTNPATTGNEIGFLAQDVQPIVPEAVWGNAGLEREDGEPLLGVTAETITALNVNAIKELHDMISALQARIEGLEAARSTHV